MVVIIITRGKSGEVLVGAGKTGVFTHLGVVVAVLECGAAAGKLWAIFTIPVGVAYAAFLRPTHQHLRPLSHNHHPCVAHNLYTVHAL